ncbi:MAG: response regulator transcription factor [Oscillospiraceae bacterium]|nr:response regulator transcription factor [Oscillospiraceae bacterium]
MLRIAICEDEAAQRQQVSGLVNDYLSTRGIAARMRLFDRGQALVDAVAGEGPFDLYILDIVMPEMSGIELGRALRGSDQNGLVVYLTSSPDFALESYQVRAFHYLLKPVRQQELFAMLDEAVGRLHRSIEASLQVRTRGSTVRIRFDDLLYAELQGRIARYNLRDGSFVESMTLSGSFREAVAPLLQDERFVLCGASFLVNLYHIEMVDRAGMRLAGGRYVALPKASCSALRAAWSDYWLEGGGKA